MATTSPVLGLKLNDLSDPFQLSDFTGNWGILDASPGVFTCTSTTRPSWASPQAGRLIFMKDLKQLSYWDGSAWQDLRDAAPIFAGGIFINTNVAPGASPVFNILTFTTPRPCSLAVWVTGLYNYPNNQTQDAWQSVTYDGAVQLMGSFRDQFRAAGNSGDSSAPAAISIPTLTVVPTVSAGQHKIGLKLEVSSSYRTPITMVGAKVITMVSLYQAGNSL